MPEVLAPLLALGTWALILWCIAMALLIADILGVVAGAIDGLPYPLNKLAGVVRSFASGITGVCARAERGVDALMGAAWHALASYTEKWWREYVEHTALALILSKIIYAIVHSVHKLEAHAGHVAGRIEGLFPRVKSLEKEWHGIEHRVKNLEREVGKGIGHDLRLEIKALERSLHGIETVTVPALRGIANTAENEAERALSEIESIPFPAGVKTWAEAIAVAIPALGLSWLNCESNPMRNNPNACSVWGKLARLLPLGALLAIGFDFREFVTAAETVAEGIGTFVGDLEAPFVGELPPLPPPKAV